MVQAGASCCPPGVYPLALPYMRRPHAGSGAAKGSGGRAGNEGYREHLVYRVGIVSLAGTQIIPPRLEDMDTPGPWVPVLVRVKTGQFLLRNQRMPNTKVNKSKSRHRDH